jgi:toxin ParE1/3/4
VPEVIISPEADRELDDQADYYDRRRTPETADRWYNQARATFRFLAQNPEIGTMWPVPHRRHRLAGVRTWPVDGFDKFIVFYRPVEGGVEILHVLRGTRDLGRLI